MKQLFFFVGWIVLLTGCGGTVLNVNDSFEVPLEGKVISIDPIRSSQTVKVAATATGGRIHVLMCREPDRDAAERELVTGQLKTAVLCQHLDTEQANIHATVPANTTALVIVQRASPKPAKVELKITNR